MKLRLFLILSVLCLNACASSKARQEEALNRAVFDLECEKSKIVLQVLSEQILRSTIGVIGCGKRAVYIVDCATNGCVTVLNSTNKDDKPAEK